MNQLTQLEYKKDQLIIKSHSEEKDLYYILSGKVLVFALNGTQVTPLAYLSRNEFIGELAFFDQSRRSAYVVAIEDTQLVKIQYESIQDYFPNWLISINQQLARKIRIADELITSHGLKKKKDQVIDPLSIEEQRHYYLLAKES